MLPSSAVSELGKPEAPLAGRMRSPLTSPQDSEVRFS